MTDINATPEAAESTATESPEGSSISSLLGGGNDAGKEGEASANGAEKEEGAQEGEQAPAEGEQAGEQEGEAEKEEGGAPEKYEFTVPEGFEGELDQKAVEAFEPIARELGLTQEQAQQLVSLQAQTIQRQHQEAMDQQSQVRQEWVEELRNDEQFGGQNFDRNVKQAQTAISRFGSPELTEVLNSSGLGNHPELVRFCAKVGATMAEDGVIGGDSSGGKRQSVEKTFYPNM